MCFSMSVANGVLAAMRSRFRRNRGGNGCGVKACFQTQADITYNSKSTDRRSVFFMFLFYDYCLTINDYIYDEDENQSLPKGATCHAVLSLVRLPPCPAPLRQRLGAGIDIERGSHADGMGAEVQGAHAAAGQTHI